MYITFVEKMNKITAKEYNNTNLWTKKNIKISSILYISWIILHLPILSDIGDSVSLSVRLLATNTWIMTETIDWTLILALATLLRGFRTKKQTNEENQKFDLTTFGFNDQKSPVPSGLLNLYFCFGFIFVP